MANSARNEEELTKSVVYFLNESVLRDARPLQIRDTERCHFVGKAKAGRPKQIIIKFAHYHDKRRVFASKSNLKNNPSKTFMTEDLTSKNHSMVEQLLTMKKGDKIDSFWTSNGRIYVKKEPTSDPIRVSMNDSISVKLELGRVRTFNRGHRVCGAYGSLKCYKLVNETVNFRTFCIITITSVQCKLKSFYYSYYNSYYNVYYNHVLLFTIWDQGQITRITSAFILYSRRRFPYD